MSQKILTLGDEKKRLSRNIGHKQLPVEKRTELHCYESLKAPNGVSVANAVWN
jgi:hypothetical protein